jgi:hypothetical protein
VILSKFLQRGILLSLKKRKETFAQVRAISIVRNTVNTDTFTTSKDSMPTSQSSSNGSNGSNGNATYCQKFHKPEGKSCQTARKGWFLTKLNHSGQHMLSITFRQPEK